MTQVHLIGNAHLDPVWLWRWQEGCNEVLQTFRSALDRLNEYPDTVFTCSSAAYYEVVESLEPEMFAEIVKRVKEGRWVPVNGWYVQPDCNLPGGESFARQALYSQLYYREKFGKCCTTGYNVDSFGHNGNLPQLLKQGGLESYVFMRPGAHENPHVPEWLFRWQGVDGTQILTFRIPDAYCKGMPFPGGSREWFEPSYLEAGKACEQLGTDLMLFYGVGNHGGGPTRWDIEYIQSRQKECQVIFSDPDSYFKAVRLQNPELPVWNNELQHHASGCYALNSPVKQWNRQAENDLFAAEVWDTLAAQVSGRKPATQLFKDAWKHLAFNQFHDIIAGCCIPEAYDDARSSIGYARQLAAQQQLAALLYFSRRIDTWIEGVSEPACCEVRHCSGVDGCFPAPVVVFNPHAQPVSTTVQVPCSPAWTQTVQVKDAVGKSVPAQIVRASRNDRVDHFDVLFPVRLPACGYATYWVQSTGEGAAPQGFDSVTTGEQDGGLVMENRYLSVRIDATSGAVVSLWDKQANTESFVAPAALPLVLDDSENDSWAHGQDYFDKLITRMTPVSVTWKEQGKLRSGVKVEYKYKDSRLQQIFYLTADQKQLHVQCRAVWQQPHTLVKLAFPITGENAFDTAEIPYGFICRKATGEEQPAQRWADVTATAKDGSLHGVAILNDGKYAYSCKENELRVTVVRNAMYADHYFGREGAADRYTDEGMQLFSYVIVPHNGPVQFSEVTNLAALLNSPAVPVRESYHKGTGAPQQASFLQLTPAGVELGAVKFAEDASGDVIVRCRETTGNACKATLMLAGYPSITFDIRGQEVFSLRLKKDGTANRVNFVEDIR